MTTDPREVLTRWAPGPDLTVRYGTHPDHVVDVRLPAGDAAGPLVIFIHGGFWKAEFDRRHTAPLAIDLAGRGYPVASVEFRRVGQDGGGWPGTFADVAEAVTRVPGLIAEAIAQKLAQKPEEAAVGKPAEALAGKPGEALTERGGRVPDLTRPVLAGHSAGGHLALWAAKRSGTPVRGVLALAPVADLGLAHRLGLGDGAVAALLGGGPDEVPDRYREADPVRLLPSGVRAVVVHGTEDDRVPVEVSRSYVAAAREAGDDVSLVELPGTEHFAVIDPQSAVWPRVLGALGSVAR